jgi:hypothetical protein
MRNSVLPVMGVLTVVAGAIGLQIGEGAIAQIDPIYFQGAPVAAQDVTKNPRPQPQPGFAQASGWAEGYAARAADCGDCPALLARHAYAPAQPGPVYTEATLQPRWAPQSVAIAPAEEAPAPVQTAEQRRMGRYLHYPINREQAEIAASVAMRSEAPSPAATSRPAPEEPAGL